VLIALLVLAVVAAVAPAALAFVIPAVIVAAVLGLARAGGQPLAMVVLQRWRWHNAARREHTSYRVGVVTAHSPAWRLPGVLAPLALLDCEDGIGGRYGIVADARTGLMTATLCVVPASLWLADQEEADGWVARWGNWLAGLGHVPMCRWVTVTVETAPEPGTTLADAVAAALEPGSPLAARQIMTQLVGAAPATAAEVSTLVSITLDPARSPAAPGNLTAAAAEAGRAMHGLETSLADCGVTILGRASAAAIAGMVRAAADPASRGEVRRVLAAGTRGPELSWADAGPVGAQEVSDLYRHDGATSVTWAWREAPRQTVTADVLARLLAPGAFPKRVSLQYRPLPAAEAARILEGEVTAAQFHAVYRHRTGRDATARDAFDEERARQAAAEEAAGAGVCLISLYVTVTVTSEDDLPRAVADIETAAESSRIRLDGLQLFPAVSVLRCSPIGLTDDLGGGSRHDKTPIVSQQQRQPGCARAGRPCPAFLGMEDPWRRAGGSRRLCSGVPGHHETGLRSVSVPRRIGRTSRRHSHRPAPAIG
jgi:hypothetical protein